MYELRYVFHCPLFDTSPQRFVVFYDRDICGIVVAGAFPEFLPILRPSNGRLLGGREATQSPSLSAESDRVRKPVYAIDIDKVFLMVGKSVGFEPDLEGKDSSC